MKTRNLLIFVAVSSALLVGHMTKADSGFGSGFAGGIVGGALGSAIGRSHRSSGGDNSARAAILEQENRRLRDRALMREMKGREVGPVVRDESRLQREVEDPEKQNSELRKEIKGMGSTMKDVLAELKEMKKRKKD